MLKLPYGPLYNLAHHYPKVNKKRCLFVVFCLRHFETQRCEFVYCRDMLEFISPGEYSPVATTTQSFLGIWYFPRQPASPDVFHQPKHSGMFPEEKERTWNTERTVWKGRSSCQPPLFGLKVSFAGVWMDTVPMHLLETIDKPLKLHRMKHRHVIFQTLVFKPFQKKTWYSQLYGRWSSLGWWDI